MLSDFYALIANTELWQRQILINIWRYARSSPFYRIYQKLILFYNLDSLILNGQQVSFITKLKLTGNNVIGSIVFPDASAEELEYFLEVNIKIFNTNQKLIIKKLVLEAQNNQRLKIEVSSNFQTL